MPKDAKPAIDKMLIKSSYINKQWIRYHAVNCWHMNEYESAAMWKLYLKSDEGIAIQSTYSKFKRSFIDDEKIYIGKVKYIDYETGGIDLKDGNYSFLPFLYKRKSFAHENEIRAIIDKSPSSFVSGKYFEQETITDGINIEVDLKELIENVYIAPSTSVWFTELVKVDSEKYNFDFNVIQSKLDDTPLF